MATGTHIGIVGEKKLSTNGKPMVHIDGRWYFAGRCDVSMINVGQRLDFAWSTFGSDPEKPLYGLDSWAMSPNQPTPAEVDAAKASAAPKPKWGGRAGGGSPKDRATEIDLQCMRFVGQVIGALIEKGAIGHTNELKAAAKEAWDAISFTRALGGSAPAPANPSYAGQNANRAGSPLQSPQGGLPPVSHERVRPTGLFGAGEKFKDIPWNVMEIGKLQWVVDKSTFSPDVKKKAADELWFREQDKMRADAVQAQMSPPQDPDDWDSDIPF